MATREVVEYDDLFSASLQAFHGCAADITCTTRHQYGHYLSFSAFNTRTSHLRFHQEISELIERLARRRTCPIPVRKRGELFLPF